MAGSELKPCPFCCGEAVLNHGHMITATGQYLANVKCSKCGIATEVVWSTDSPEEAVREAVEAWNRREERTAKAEWSEVDGCHLCGECGFAVCPNCDVYCAGCGARLEWK